MGGTEAPREASVPEPSGSCPQPAAKGLLPLAEPCSGRGALGTEAAGFGDEGKQAMLSGSRALDALSHSGAKGFLSFRSSAAKAGAVREAELVMFPEPGTWSVCPPLETKGLFALLIRCTERKAGRGTGARVGSVALGSSSGDRLSLQKGTKNSHVTWRCNTRQEQTSFSTSLHQLCHCRRAVL